MEMSFLDKINNNMTVVFVICLLRVINPIYLSFTQHWNAGSSCLMGIILLTLVNVDVIPRLSQRLYACSMNAGCQ